MNTIDIFPWDDNFDTGLPKVDEQHRKLVQMLNLLASNIAYGANAGLLNQIFDEMADYAVYHFQTEGGIWREYLADDPDEVGHRAIHQSFVQEVVRLKASLESRSLSEVAEETLGFLARWLASHILESDRYLAYVVLAQKEGMPLAAAKVRAKEQMGGATRALIDIILSIYSTLSANTLRLMRELAAHRQDKEELLLVNTRLQESETNLRSFFDTIDDFLFVLDGTGAIQRVNRIVVERLGYPEADLTGKSVLTVHPPERYEEAMRIVGDMLAGKGDSCPIPLQTADGRLIPVETRIVHGQWHGQPALFGVSRDITRQKEIERELSARERSQRALLDNFPFMVWLKDTESRFLAVNRPFAEACNRNSAEELKGLTDLDIWPQDLAEAYRADDREVLASGRPKHVEEQIETPDGRLWYETYKSPIVLKDEIMGTVGFARDITERKRAEETLRDTLARYSTLLDNLPLVIWQKDLDSSYVACNANFARHFGTTREGVVGRTDHDFHPAELAEKYLADDRRIIATLVGESYEEEYVANGQVHHVHTRKLPLIDENGRCYGTLGIAEDISERKQAEEALRQSKTLLDSIIENIPNMIFLKDAKDLRFVRMNRAGEELTGIPRQELLGKNDYDFFPVQEADFFTEKDRQVLASKEMLDIPEEPIQTQTHGIRFLHTKKIPLMDKDGRPEYLLGISEDITERKQAEEEVRQSKAETERLLDESVEREFFLRQSQEVGQIGGWRADPVNNRVMWTEGVYKIVEMPLEYKSDLETALDFYLPDSRVRVVENLQHSLATGEPFSIQVQVRGAKSGQVKWTELRGQPHHDAEGRIDYMMGTIQDISAQKKIEQALKEAQHLAKLGGWELDIPNGHLHWSDEIFRIFEIDPAKFEASYEAFLDAIHPADREAVNTAYTNSLLTREPYSIRHRLRMKDGRIKHVLEQCQTDFDTDGTPLRSVGTAQDVTRQVLAEQALQDSRNLLQLVIDNVPMRVFWKDRALNYLGCNPAFAHDAGKKSPAEMIGKDDYQMGWAHEADLYRADDRQVIESGSPRINFEEPQTTPDGRTIWLRTSKVPLKNTDNEVIGVLGIYDDITDRKKAEEEKVHLQAQLAQAQKLESVGRLAGGVAHDFNNKLGVILGYTEMAQMQAGGNDKLQSYLREIDLAAEQSAVLTRQMLAYARKQVIAPKVLDLNETVTGMLKMLQRLIGEDISIAWVPGAQLWPVNIDPSQVDQILANLAINARDAITDTGKITIETQNVVIHTDYCASHPEAQEGAFVMLAVSDNGSGIAPELREKIFEPFFTTKGVGKGTGLGLATVYGIARQNEGWVSLYSEVGHGSTFKIYFPRHTVTEVAPEKAAASSAAPLGRGETILLVEDEMPLLNMCSSILEDLGYRVIKARNPVEALRVARENSGIDLLLTDVVMPEMNGRELSQQIAVLHPHVKCLFMSGYTANVIAHHGVLDEGTSFLAKPFSRKELADKVLKTLYQS